MPRILARPLSEKEVRALTKTSALGGVPGLVLRIRAGCTKTYVLVKNVGGVRRFWTVGQYGTMTLSAARARAAEMVKAIEEGRDPSEEKKAAFKESKRAEAYTVYQLLMDFLTAEDARGRWDNRGRMPHVKKAEGWINNHMGKKFLAKDAKKLTAQDVATEFQKKWLSMRSTPEKCIGELKRAYDWGMALQKIPAMDNPASLRGALGHLLPPPSARPKRTHMPYLEPEKMPAFCRELMRRSGCGPRCLLFSILTASRSDNVLMARWDQIDLERRVFTIPREEMKIKGLSFARETPLSPTAVAILQGLPRYETPEGRPDWVFRNFQKGNGHISPNTWRALILRIDRETEGHPYHDPIEVDAFGRHRLPVPHGLARASFDTWARNPTKYGHELFDPDFIEACLDHFSPKYGGAYMRAYPLEDMRKIFDAWDAFLMSNI